MGALDAGGAAGRERLRGPLVRAEPPGARSGLVDGAPDQRVAEAKTAGHVGVTDKVALEELVERVHSRRLGLPAAAAASSGSNGSPATAAPSRIRRVGSESSASSSISAAATALGTSTPAMETPPAAGAPFPVRRGARASCSR